MSNPSYTSHDVVEWTAYLTHAEVDELYALAQSLSPNPTIVNIGAGNGTSTLAFMQSRPDALVYSIDIQLESSPYGCLEGERLVLEKAGFVGNPRYQQIHGDSKEVGKTWIQYQYGLVDMVFVDGGHFEWECRGDINTWLPLIKRGGVMAVHDFEKREKVWVGVNVAVRDLLIGKYEEVSRVDSLIAFRV